MTFSALLERREFTVPENKKASIVAMLSVVENALFLFILLIAYKVALITQMA